MLNLTYNKKDNRNEIKYVEYNFITKTTNYSQF